MRTQNRKFRQLKEVIDHSSIYILSQQIPLTCEFIYDYLETVPRTKEQIMDPDTYTKKLISLYAHCEKCACNKKRDSLVHYQEYIDYNELGNYVDQEVYSKHGMLGILCCGGCDVNIDGAVDDLIEFDIVYLLPYDDKTVRKVINRCKRLQDTLPSIWKIAEPQYKIYVDKIYKSIFTSKINLDILRELLELFPDGSILDVIDKYGHNFRIAALGHKDIAQFMGVSNPCIQLSDKLSISESFFVDPEQLMVLQEKLRTINKMKLELFISEVRLVYLNCKVINIETMSGDIIDDYIPSDIFRYADEDGNIYQFVRSEIESLCKTGKNPFNNLPLSNQFIDYIEIYDDKDICRRSAPFLTMIEDLLNPIGTRTSVIENVNEADNIPFTLLCRDKRRIFPEISVMGSLGGITFVTF